MRAFRALGPLAVQHQVKLTFSDIVAGEVQGHIRRDAAEQTEKLRTALSKALRTDHNVQVAAFPPDHSFCH